MVGDDLVNAKQAAAIVGLSEQSIRRLCSQDFIKATKVGRDWVIERKALEGIVKRKNTGRPPRAPKEDR